MAVDVWRTAGLKRVLVTSDVLANSITVLILLLGVMRFRANLEPTPDAKDVFFGAGHTIPAYLVSAVGPLLLLEKRPDTYFRHRTRIVTAIRIHRLIMLHLTLVGSTSGPTIARIAVGRALRAAQTGLVILLVQPMAFYMHHALYLLPWQLAAPFQLATTVGVLHWNARFACFLRQAQPELASLPWYGRATKACEGLQSYASLLTNTLGLPLSEVSHTLCQGESAVSVLQMFWTLFGVCLIPCTLTVELERWMRLRYQQQEGRGGGAEPTGSRPSSSHGPQYDAGSSSVSSSGPSAVSGSWPGHSIDGAGSSNVRNIHSLSVAEFNGLTEGPCKAGSVGGHACMLLIVLLLLCPVLWLLAELLAEGLAANRECAVLPAL